MPLDAKIEAILFFKGEPVTIPFISKTLGCSEEEARGSLDVLKEKLSGRGVVVVEAGGEISLGTHPDISEAISELEKREVDSELSKASLDTLTIVIYRGPISKAEIDFIRGVNSAFILRNLLVRGLVLRDVDPKDRRGFVYSPSTELLSHLGVADRESLPGFGRVNEKIESFKKSFTESQEENA